MLNITIKMNDNEVEHIIKYDTESYNDPFVNNKQIQHKRFTRRNSNSNSTAKTH